MGNRRAVARRDIKSGSWLRDSRGFTLIEMLVTVAVIMVMTAAAVPLAQSTIAQFRLRAAASSVTGIIQSTRFQAISSGYQYKVAFDKTTHSYQVSSDPTGSGTFTNVGGAIPFTAGSTPVGLGANATLQLSPSGKVSFITGASPLLLTLKGKTGTVSVTTYGNLSVTY
jgi:type IV fimbrial biogenesis protein FimT